MACCDCCCPEGEECCKAPGANGICCAPDYCCGTDEVPICCDAEAGEFCCEEVCCDAEETCCEGVCCPEGAVCCEGVCCEEGECCVDGECAECAACSTAEDCNCSDVGWSDIAGVEPRICCPPGFDYIGDGYCDDGVDVVQSALFGELVGCIDGVCTLAAQPP